jgi:hypothetical protein
LSCEKKDLGIAAQDISRIMAGVSRLQNPELQIEDVAVELSPEEDVAEMEEDDDNLFFNRQKTVPQSTKLKLLVHTLEKVFVGLFVL